MYAISQRLSILVAVVAGAMALPEPATGGVANAQSVTGAGHYEFTSDAGVTALRTFALEARRSADGTVTGRAQVKNRATGQTVHVEIDCLNVIGNIAVLSGTARSATGPGNADGDAEIFGVQDNSNGPDRATRLFGNSGLVCTDITPANVGLYTYLFDDVDGGSIVIH
jgi:hypothetical protein